MWKYCFYDFHFYEMEVQLASMSDLVVHFGQPVIVKIDILNQARQSLTSMYHSGKCSFCCNKWSRIMNHKTLVNLLSVALQGFNVVHSTCFYDNLISSFSLFCYTVCKLYHNNDANSYTIVVTNKHVEVLIHKL